MPELLRVDLQRDNNKNATNLFVNNTIMSGFDTHFSAWKMLVKYRDKYGAGNYSVLNDLTGLAIAALIV